MNPDHFYTNDANESMSDFGVFAEDLIERYLRGQISFNEFCNAGGTAHQPSSSSIDESTVVVIVQLDKVSDN